MRENEREEKIIYVRGLKEEINKGRMRNSCLIGMEFRLGAMKNVLELGRGGVCTTLGIY